MYNKYRNHAPFKTSSKDFVSQWKDKNQGLLKYAGDRAKKSINAGLEEAPDFMRDADEGTSFENVQNASVKRRLANDANDSKLYNSATMEMIGHLSKENKGPYLKAAQPLQKYIDVKDEFDFKHNNYTTTENVDKTPDENVRQLQRELNEAGYTDKFGQKLKEDGIYGGKTAYADDMRRADNPNMASDSSTVNNKHKTTIINDIEYPMVIKEDIQPKLLDNSQVKLSSGNLESNRKSSQYDVPDLKKLMEEGTLSPGDESRNPLKKTMIKRLSSNWWRNIGNDENQKKIATIGDKLRKFDDNHFNKAYYLNNSTSAGTMGHNAVMLMNKDGYATVFSFYPQSEEFKESFDTEAEMRFSVLTPEQAKRVLEGDGYIFGMSASDGGIKTEIYNRYLEFDISNGQGYNMYYKAINLYSNPGTYKLTERQCDDIACEILNNGGIDIDATGIPNISYKHKENKILVDKIWKTIKESLN